MDNGPSAKGLANHKAALSGAFVARSPDAADDFIRLFQEAMTAWCWHFGRDDKAIDAEPRSLMSRAIIAAMEEMNKRRIHRRRARNSGVAKNKLRATIHVAGLYSGAPHSAGCFRAVRKIH